MQFEVLKLVSAQCFPLMVTLGFQKEGSFLSSLLPVTGPSRANVSWDTQFRKGKERSWLGLCRYRQKNLCTLKEKSLLGWHLRSDLTSPSMEHGFLVLFLRGWGELCCLWSTKKNI